MRAKVIILLPCWGRASVLKIVSDNIKKVSDINYEKIELTTIFVVSGEDAEISQILEIYRNANYSKSLVYAPNNKIGQKHNLGIKRALEIGFDYLMNMGSDDLFHHSIFDLYLPYMKQKKDIFGVNKLYFYDAQKHQTIFFSYQNSPHIVGAGRMISYKAIKKCVKEFGSLYPADASSGLDGKSAKNLESLGFEQYIIDIGQFPMIVDVKTKTNINSFKRIQHSQYRNSIERVDNRIIKLVYQDI